MGHQSGNASANVRYTVDQLAEAYDAGQHILIIPQLDTKLLDAKYAANEQRIKDLEDRLANMASVIESLNVRSATRDDMLVNLEDEHD